MKQKGIVFLLTFLIGILSFGLSHAQVTAEFSGTPLSGCSPLVVSYTDLSTGPVTTWFWDFGNGNTSTLQNPAAVYFTPGTYTISLTVTDGGALSDSETKTAYVTVFENPTADFAAAGSTSGCAPHTVTFNDLSIPGDAAITGFLWDFGDGSFSTDASPTHTYATPGDYSITLVVTDANTCTNTLLITDYISVTNAVDVTFSGSPLAACTPPLDVNFTSTVTGGTAPFTYAWDFGDGNTATTANPSNTYTALGAYDVMLTVTDPSGCSDTETLTNYVNINDIVADFSAAPLGGCENQPVTFTDLTTGGADTWAWDFGDGGTSALQNPSYTYTASGTYTVSLTSSNSSGCSDNVFYVDLITISPEPTADFTGAPLSSCDVPLTVNFTDASIGATSWDWDFGDGNTSTLQNPSNTYTAPGVYTVSLTVMNADGCANTFTETNYVSIVEPVADFTGFPLDGCAPLSVDFTDLSTSVEPIVSWEWDFGDGNVSGLQNPTNVYTLPGTYTVSLVITNSAGCTDTLVRPDYVAPGDIPISDFSATPTLACVDDVITFTDLSTNATDWFWEFGDGGTSGATNPTYMYNDTGCFDVTLTVENSGCEDVFTIPDYICIFPPVALFNLDAPVGCSVPHTVNFTDASTGPVDIWLWRFGDGTTSALQNPSHTYAAVGTYTVWLIVTNSTVPCIDSISATINISVADADFSGAPLFGCGPLTTNFTDLSVGATAWAWDFGDGGTSTAQNPTYTYNTPGIYTVTLTTTDANGCSATHTETSYVQVIGPNVNFSLDDPGGCLNHTVNFTDLTIFGAPITSWTWDFGDGATSGLQNPFHTYTTTGTFDVSLTVTDIDGCSRTLTMTAAVQVTDPTAGFGVVDSLGCSGFAFNFTNTSVGVGLSYAWDFGDGGTSTATNPSYSYAADGTYDVKLVVTDVNGCQDSVTNIGIITVQDLLTNFGAAPTNASCPPLLVTFTDSSQYSITSWEWDFGDGTGSVLQDPSHVYSIAGSYDVTLNVQNSQGCRDTLFVPGLVNILGPSGSFVFSPDSGCTPFTATFEATALNTVSYTWDFGDGNVVVGGDSLVHTYTQTGSFYPVCDFG